MDVELCVWLLVTGSRRHMQTSREAHSHINRDLSHISILLRYSRLLHHFFPNSAPPPHHALTLFLWPLPLLNPEFLLPHLLSTSISIYLSSLLWCGDAGLSTVLLYEAKAEGERGWEGGKRGGMKIEEKRWRSSGAKCCGDDENFLSPVSVTSHSLSPFKNMDTFFSPLNENWMLLQSKNPIGFGQSMAENQHESMLQLALLNTFFLCSYGQLFNYKSRTAQCLLS